MYLLRFSTSAGLKGSLEDQPAEEHQEGRRYYNDKDQLPIKPDAGAIQKFNTVNPGHSLPKLLANFVHVMHGKLETHETIFENTF